MAPARKSASSTRTGKATTTTKTAAARRTTTAVASGKTKMVVNNSKNTRTKKASISQTKVVKAVVARRMTTTKPSPQKKAPAPSRLAAASKLVNNSKGRKTTETTPIPRAPATPPPPRPSSLPANHRSRPSTSTSATKGSSASLPPPTPPPPPQPPASLPAFTVMVPSEPSSLENSFSSIAIPCSSLQMAGGETQSTTTVSVAPLPPTPTSTSTPPSSSSLRQKQPPQQQQQQQQPLGLRFSMALAEDSCDASSNPMSADPASQAASAAERLTSSLQGGTTVLLSPFISSPPPSHSSASAAPSYSSSQVPIGSLLDSSLLCLPLEARPAQFRGPTFSFQLNTVNGHDIIDISNQKEDVLRTPSSVPSTLISTVSSGVFPAAPPPPLRSPTTAAQSGSTSITNDSSRMPSEASWTGAVKSLVSRVAALLRPSAAGGANNVGSVSTSPPQLISAAATTANTSNDDSPGGISHGGTLTSSSSPVGGDETMTTPVVADVLSAVPGTPLCTLDVTPKPPQSLPRHHTEISTSTPCRTKPSSVVPPPLSTSNAAAMSVISPQPLTTDGVMPTITTPTTTTTTATSDCPSCAAIAHRAQVVRTALRETIQSVVQNDRPNPLIDTILCTPTPHNATTPSVRNTPSADVNASTPHRAPTQRDAEVTPTHHHHNPLFSTPNRSHHSMFSTPPAHQQQPSSFRCVACVAAADAAAALNPSQSASPSRGPKARGQRLLQDPDGNDDGNTSPRRRARTERQAYSERKNPSGNLEEEEKGTITEEARLLQDASLALRSPTTVAVNIEKVDDVAESPRRLEFYTTTDHHHHRRQNALVFSIDSCFNNSSGCFDDADALVDALTREYEGPFSGEDNHYFLHNAGCNEGIDSQNQEQPPLKEATQIEKKRGVNSVGKKVSGNKGRQSSTNTSVGAAATPPAAPTAAVVLADAHRHCSPNAAVATAGLAAVLHTVASCERTATLRRLSSQQYTDDLRRSLSGAGGAQGLPHRYPHHDPTTGISSSPFTNNNVNIAMTTAVLGDQTSLRMDRRRSRNGEPPEVHGGINGGAPGWSGAGAECQQQQHQQQQSPLVASLLTDPNDDDNSPAAGVSSISVALVVDDSGLNKPAHFPAIISTTTPSTPAMAPGTPGAAAGVTTPSSSVWGGAAGPMKEASPAVAAPGEGAARALFPCDAIADCASTQPAAAGPFLASSFGDKYQAAMGGDGNDAYSDDDCVDGYERIVAEESNRRIRSVIAAVRDKNSNHHHNASKNASSSSAALNISTTSKSNAHQQYSSSALLSELSPEEYRFATASSWLFANDDDDDL